MLLLRGICVPVFESVLSGREPPLILVCPIEHYVGKPFPSSFVSLPSHLNEAVLVFCTAGYMFILTPCLTVRLGWGTHPQWLPAFSRIGFFRQHFRLICRWTIYLLRCNALSLPHPIPALPCHVIPDPPGRFMPLLLCTPSVMRGKLRSLSPSAEWTWTPCRSLSGSSFPRVHHAFRQTL